MSAIDQRIAWYYRQVLQDFRIDNRIYLHLKFVEHFIAKHFLS